MSMRLNKPAYEQLVAEDLEWLSKQPRTLERDHVEVIVRASVDHCYPPEQPAKPSPAHPDCIDCGEPLTSCTDGRCRECLLQHLGSNVTVEGIRAFCAEHERYQRLRYLEALGEVIAAAIEAERLTQEYGWERRAITCTTVADWDEASQKWVMR